MTMLERRTVVLCGVSALALTGVTSPAKAAQIFEVARSEEEWRALLRADQYAVLREAVTEEPHTSPLEREHRVGIYACAGCGQALFSSKYKYDSGTGWPTFSKPLVRAVRTGKDNSFLMQRTLVDCRRCGSHIGHVFGDGPPPAYLRYCMNGLALNFTPS
jgi:peptide-methionine (R)-S-oxide reductase